MATLAQEPVAPVASDDRFFLRAAIVMTIVIVAGFSLNWFMGRSTFHAPLRVHAHAVVFMGWVAIYLLQNVFVATDRMAWHRRLGWVAAAWMLPMIVLGCFATVAMVRNGQVPFVFRPLHFLIFDTLTVFSFVGLTSAAIALRRQTGWHRRLHFCAMSLLLMPAIGRLLPMPFLIPWAWEWAFAASLLFPIAGIASDVRRSGRAHPAWRWGIAAMIGTFVLVEAATFSAFGPALYKSVTAGSPGAALGPLDYPPPPPGAPGH
ncbi:MAG TPA: hypothetical protein VF750_09075 [Sphingomicrobium sp.]